MTRSLTKELLTPFKELKQEFQSSRKLFKTLSLDESRSSEYNLFYDIDENSEEEVAKTMEQYMSKTRSSKRLQNILKSGTMEHLGQEVLKLLMDWLQFKLNSTILEENQEANGALNIGNSIPQKEKDPRSVTLTCYINNVCFDNALADLGASVSVMPFSTYLNLGLGELAHTKLTIELADSTVKCPKGISKNLLVRIGKFVIPVDFIILDMPEDVKVPLILGKPFLSTAHAKIDVFKRKITLRVGDEKIILKSIKPVSSLIKRIYMLCLRECMKLDLEARLTGETLVLNRSLDPLYEDYIKLNDLNMPLELRRDQVDDLMPTIEKGEVNVEPMIDIIKTRNYESFDEYPSFCDFDQKIHINCAYNLRFSCMIVVENMDGYRGQDMGDAIFGEPICKASCVEARRFDGIVTIHNGTDNITYQMT
uniref:Reverse transcriptase domain-containing protein n=1 Tax=Tanacetum cinerariifolium TaxID=118510 RepID=A0A699GZW1_TANCI|nr:hypothetical protein [Tanacetum cinerariifolium]